MVTAHWKHGQNSRETRGYRLNEVHSKLYTLRWQSVEVLAEDRSSFPGIVKDFHITMYPDKVLVSTQSLIQWLTQAISPAVNRSGREAGHSPLTSREAKKTWDST
jgi:hypothetical protein